MSDTVSEPHSELPSSGLIGSSLEESKYKPDFQVLDRYQKYSAELLRLSLLGIAGYGYIIKEVLNVCDAKEIAMRQAVLDYKWMLMCGVVALGMSSGLALAHRGLSSESIAYLIAFLRASGQTAGIEHNGRAEKEKAGFHWYLKVSGRCLIASAVCLGAGSLFIAATFACILWTAK